MLSWEILGITGIQAIREKITILTTKGRIQTIISIKISLATLSRPTIKIRTTFRVLEMEINKTRMFSIRMLVRLGGTITLTLIILRVTIRLILGGIIMVEVCRGLIKQAQRQLEITKVRTMIQISIRKVEEVEGEEERQGFRIKELMIAGISRTIKTSIPRVITLTKIPSKPLGSITTTIIIPTRSNHLIRTISITQPLPIIPGSHKTIGTRIILIKMDSIRITLVEITTISTLMGTTSLLTINKTISSLRLLPITLPHPTSTLTSKFYFLGGKLKMNILLII